MIAPALLAEEEKELPFDPKEKLEKQSYALGVDLARNFKRQGMEVDLDEVIKGLKDGYSGEKLPLPEKVLRQLISNAQTDVLRKQAHLRGKTPAQANKIRGDDFLAENQERPGVVTLTNGLQYLVLKPGAGRKPDSDDTVEVYYRATRLDGSEFLCTNPGQPQAMAIKDSPFAAWRQALLLMPVGAKWKLFVPSQLAYGTQGVGRDVNPNEAIILELELVKIK